MDRELLSVLQVDIRIPNSETNLCLLIHGSSFLTASSPAHPVQELLSEQRRLVVLGDAAEQRPAGPSLSPPEHTSRDSVKYTVWF